MRAAGLFACALALVACDGADPADAGPGEQDAGRPDAGGIDAGPAELEMTVVTFNSGSWSSQALYSSVTLAFLSSTALSSSSACEGLKGKPCTMIPLCVSFSEKEVMSRATLRVISSSVWLEGAGLMTLKMGKMLG